MLWYMGSIKCMPGASLVGARPRESRQASEPCWTTVNRLRRSGEVSAKLVGRTRRGMVRVSDLRARGMLAERIAEETAFSYESDRLQ